MKELDLIRKSWPHVMEGDFREKEEMGGALEEGFALVLRLELIGINYY